MRRLSLAALAAMALAATTVVVAVPATAQEQPAPDEPAAPAGLELVSSSPWVAADGELEVVIATTGDAGPSVARVAIHRPVTSVDALDRALDGEPGSATYTTPPIPLGFVPVNADGTRDLVVGVSPTSQGELTARLRTPGVYPVSVTLTDPDGVVRSTEHTIVIRLGTPDDPLTAPTLAVVVEVAVEPTVGPDGARTLTPRDLARLDRIRSFLDQLADGVSEPAPVSVAVVPDALDALTASSDVRAAAVVDVLTGLDARHLALGLPYVAVSPQALLDADLGGFFPDLVTLGRRLLDDRLVVTVDPTTWPPAAPVGPEGARALADLGVGRLLVDAGDPPDDPRRLPITDAGPRPLAGLDPLVGVVVDRATTATLLAPGEPVVALAELLLRTPDQATPTTAVLRVDDVPTDAVLRTLAPLLADPTAPVAIGGLELVPAEPGPDAVAFQPVFPDPVDGLAEVAAEVRAVDAAVDTFAQTVAGESARAIDLRLRVATALAATLTVDERRALLGAAAAEVEATFDTIFLGGQTDLNLTSRTGTLPLELHNEAGFPVKVVVTVRSERLLFPQGDRFEIVLDEEITRLDVPVEARATGSVPTFVTVTTPDGTVRLDMRQLNVRSTAISGVGLFLSFGALAVLVVWWGRSWWRGRATEAAT